MAPQICTAPHFGTQGMMPGWKQCGEKAFLTVKKSARCTRRTGNPVFKARVVLAALRKDKTMAELCRAFELHPKQIAFVKKQLLERTADVFCTEATELIGLVPLHAKTGQLALENDFLLVPFG